jgi:hypothetical protein
MNQPIQGAKASPRLVVGGTAQPAPAVSPPKPQQDAISTFIGLEIEARQCATLASLRHTIVNAPRKLADYDEAFLACPAASGRWRISHASSVHKIDRHAPFLQFLDAWLNRAALSDKTDQRSPHFFDLKADAAQFGLDGMDVPAAHYGFWLPIKGRKDNLLGILLAMKREPWRPQSVSLLIPLASAYGHAWQALTPDSKTAVRTVSAFMTRSRLAIACCSFAAIAAFLPVPLSCLSPAEVVARQPWIVASPMDGVIADVLVPPGAPVEKDMPILTFADVNLRNAFEQAKSNKAVAQAKYFKAVQTATAMQKEVEDVAIAKAELDLAATELAYAEEMLSRSTLKADRAGLLIYSSKSDWIGRPVKTGERIMEIGNPSETELRIEVPVSDAMTLGDNSDVSFFLDGDPLTAVKARVTRANYRPAPNGENQLVYRVHASFSEGGTRRIGLRGVARVSSGHVPLAFYLFRKPLAAIRQRFGL